MRVITIGSKIVDDAIVSCGSGTKIKNVNRITNISPFVICFNGGSKEVADLPDKSKDAYVSYMQRVEMSGQLELTEDFDAVVIDVLDARLPFYEVTYDNSKIIRISDNNFNAGIIDSLKNDVEKKKNIRIKKVNPIKCNSDELKTLFGEYAAWLKNICKDKKVILVCNCNAYQTLDEDGVFTVSDKISSLMQYNDFYGRCVDVIKDMLDCQIIPAPSYICADTKGNGFFSLNRFYYQYLLGSLADIMEGAYDSAKRLREYNYAMQRYYEKCITGRLVRDIKLHRADRSIVLIGGTEELQKDLCEKTGSDVFRKIDINTETSHEEIMAGLTGLNKSLQLCVVVYLKANKYILKTLNNMGFDSTEDVVMPTHEAFTLGEFVGKYEDIFGNYIEVKALSDIKVSGCGNYISVGVCNNTIRFNIVVGDYNRVIVEEYGNIMFNKCLFLQGIMGSEINIGSYCRIVNNLKIYAGKFGRIIIGRRCLISSDVLLHCGDGLAEKSGVDDSIVLDEWVWLGYRTTLIAGAHLHSGCIVGARALVAQEIPNNCMVAGDPARIIRRNITWHPDIMENDINAVPEQYRKLTDCGET